MWGWVGGKSREETPPPFPVTTNSMSGSRGVGRDGVLRKDMEPGAQGALSLKWTAGTMGPSCLFYILSQQKDGVGLGGKPGQERWL